MDLHTEGDKVTWSRDALANADLSVVDRYGTGPFVLEYVGPVPADGHQYPHPQEVIASWAHDPHHPIAGGALMSGALFVKTD